MSEASPGTRLVSKEPSELQVNALFKTATIGAIRGLHNLVRSSYGPHGRIKVIHNNSGGHVMMTSSLARLIDNLTVKEPILRLITSSLQGYCKTYSDGGLFTALMSLNLILKSVHLHVERRLILDINEILLHECIQYLQSDESSSVKIALDLSDLKHLETIVTSVIGTKPTCDLQSSEVSHLSRILANAFVSTFRPSSSDLHSSSINYVTVLGTPPNASHVRDGVLFAAPDIPTYREKKFGLCRDEAGFVKAAVFNVSLAGDAEGTIQATYEISEGLDIEQVMVETMAQLVDIMIRDRVGAVFCQKVVHPLIKLQLRRNGILVVERLGSQYISAIQTLTGASFISSLTLPKLTYGRLTNIQHMVLGGRSFLHFENTHSPVCSVVLSNRTENSLDEMKQVSQAAHDVLHMALYNPLGLAGGGCWQTNLACHLRKTMVNRFNESKLQYSMPQISCITNAFCDALEDVALTITRTYKIVHTSIGHHWSFDIKEGNVRPEKNSFCTCGMYSINVDPDADKQSKGDCDTPSDVKLHSQSNVKRIDLFEIGINGLKSAVAIANMVLGIHYSICDKN